MIKLFKNNMKRNFLALSIISALAKDQIKSTSDVLDTERNALCILYPDNDSGVHGLVSFNQKDYTSNTKIVATVI